MHRRNAACIGTLVALLSSLVTGAMVTRAVSSPTVNIAGCFRGPGRGGPLTRDHFVITPLFSAEYPPVIGSGVTDERGCFDVHMSLRPVVGNWARRYYHNRANLVFTINRGGVVGMYGTWIPWTWGDHHLGLRHVTANIPKGVGASAGASAGVGSHHDFWARYNYLEGDLRENTQYSYGQDSESKVTLAFKAGDRFEASGWQTLGVSLRAGTGGDTGAKTDAAGRHLAWRSMLRLRETHTFQCRYLPGNPPGAGMDWCGTVARVTWATGGARNFPTEFKQCMDLPPANRFLWHASGGFDHFAKQSGRSLTSGFDIGLAGIAHATIETVHSATNRAVYWWKRNMVGREFTCTGGPDGTSVSGSQLWVSTHLGGPPCGGCHCPLEEAARVARSGC